VGRSRPRSECSDFWALAHTSLYGAWPVTGAPETDGSVQTIGVSLLTNYSLPFELISLCSGRHFSAP